MTTTQTPTAEATYRDLLTTILTRLTRAHRRHVRWLAACDAYTTALEAFPRYGNGGNAHFDQATRAAAAGVRAPKASLMPSKEAKHRMYGDADQALRVLAALNVADLPARPGTLDEIDTLIAFARAYLTR